MIYYAHSKKDYCRLFLFHMSHYKITYITFMVLNIVTIIMIINWYSVNQK